MLAEIREKRRKGGKQSVRRVDKGDDKQKLVQHILESKEELKASKTSLVQQILEGKAELQASEANLKKAEAKLKAAESNSSPCKGEDGFAIAWKACVSVLFKVKPFRESVLSQAWYSLPTLAATELANVFEGPDMGDNVKLRRFCEAMGTCAFGATCFDFFSIFRASVAIIPGWSCSNKPSHLNEGVRKLWVYQHDPPFATFVVVFVWKDESRLLPNRFRDFGMEYECSCHLQFSSSHEDGVYLLPQEEMFCMSGVHDLLLYTAVGERSFGDPEVLSLRFLNCLSRQDDLPTLLSQCFLRDRNDRAQISARRVLAFSTLVAETSPCVRRVLAREGGLFDEWHRIAPEERLRRLAAIAKAVIEAFFKDLMKIARDDLLIHPEAHMTEAEIFLLAALFDFNSDLFDYMAVNVGLDRFLQDALKVLGAWVSKAALVPNSIREAARALERATKKHFSGKVGSLPLMQLPSTKGSHCEIPGRGGYYWNLRPEVYGGNVFDLHFLEEDLWSSVVSCDVHNDIFGRPGVTLTFTVSDSQAASIRGFENGMMSYVVPKYPERGVTVSTLFTSLVKMGPDGLQLVSLRLALWNDDPYDRCSVRHHMPSRRGGRPEGTRLVHGWDEIRPLIENGTFRNAELRAKAVECVRVQRRELEKVESNGRPVQGFWNHLEIVMEIRELEVRELQFQDPEASGVRDPEVREPGVREPKVRELEKRPPARSDSENFAAFLNAAGLLDAVFDLHRMDKNKPLEEGIPAQKKCQRALAEGLRRYRARLGGARRRRVQVSELLECLVDNAESGEILQRRLRKRRDLRSASGLSLGPWAEEEDGTIACEEVLRVCLGCLDAVSELTLFWPVRMVECEEGWNALETETDLLLRGLEEAGEELLSELRKVAEALGVDFDAALASLKGKATAVLQACDGWAHKRPMAVKAHRRAIGRLADLPRSYANLRTAFVVEPYSPFLDGVVQVAAKARAATPPPQPEHLVQLPDLEAIINGENDTARQSKLRRPQAAAPQPPAREAAARPENPQDPEEAPKRTQKQRRQARAADRALKRRQEKRREEEATQASYRRRIAVAMESKEDDSAHLPSSERSQQLLRRKLRMIRRQERCTGRTTEAMTHKLPAGTVNQMLLANGIIRIGT